MNKKLKEVLPVIGQYYLEKHNGNYDAAQEDIIKSRINDVKLYGDRLYIETSCPGWMIGKRGENITDLQCYMLKHSAVKYIGLIETEEHVLDLIMPVEPIPDFDGIDYSGGGW